MQKVKNETRLLKLNLLHARRSSWRFISYHTFSPILMSLTYLNSKKNNSNKLPFTLIHSNRNIVCLSQSTFINISDGKIFLNENHWKCESPERQNRVVFSSTFSNALITNFPPAPVVFQHNTNLPVGTSSWHLLHHMACNLCYISPSKFFHFHWKTQFLRQQYTNNIVTEHVYDIFP